MTQFHPSVLNRLYALVRGEVSADTLEGYRRAGQGAYELFAAVELERQTLAAKGSHPWAVDQATRVRFVCTWNAFALQVLGDRFLDADYKQVPLTAGFVPPVTARQVLGFYDQVANWLTRAERAGQDAAYRLDLSLPAELPEWVEVEPCPKAHLEGMLEAARSLREHAETALHVFEETASRQGGLDARQRAVVDKLRGLNAQANTELQYAERQWTPNVTEDLHESIESHLKSAIGQYYGLGQALIAPELADQLEKPSQHINTSGSSNLAILALPGQPGFDPWCLTDPNSRAKWQQDTKAQKAVNLLWQSDPNSKRTLEIQAEIDAALERQDISLDENLGSYFCCPWSAIYRVKRGLTIGDTKLRALEQFTFDVSAEEMAEGGAFKREVMTGSFQPTNDVDYCDPTND